MLFVVLFGVVVLCWFGVAMVVVCLSLVCGFGFVLCWLSFGFGCVSVLICFVSCAVVLLRGSLRFGVLVVLSFVMFCFVACCRAWCLSVLLCLS